ncbi:hypothetical protein F2Q68_00031668 [Brassica cretica]|uniref:Uncharacterized protein n=2 Tax=Brassica cretica TaxID=69181 RepID=A0A3N6QPF0_BRACR|nr:hypothetical protein F2Q68_00031668 [Brassica cretica]KAF3532254.1 hypothetical protein DY000_02041481 [Brassica cretica]
MRAGTSQDRLSRAEIVAEHGIKGFTIGKRWITIGLYVLDRDGGSPARVYRR